MWAQLNGPGERLGQISSLPWHGIAGSGMPDIGTCKGRRTCMGLTGCQFPAQLFGIRLDPVPLPAQDNLVSLWIGNIFLFSLAFSQRNCSSYSPLDTAYSDSALRGVWKCLCKGNVFYGRRAYQPLGWKMTRKKHSQPESWMELDSVPYSALTRISEEGQEQSQRVFRQTQLGMAEPRRQTSVWKVSGRGVQDSAGQQANPRGLVRKPDCKQPLFEKDSIRRNLQKDLPDHLSQYSYRYRAPPSSPVGQGPGSMGTTPDYLLPSPMSPFIHSCHSFKGYIFFPFSSSPLFPHPAFLSPSLILRKMERMID